MNNKQDRTDPIQACSAELLKILEDNPKKEKSEKESVNKEALVKKNEVDEKSKLKLKIKAQNKLLRQKLNQKVEEMEKLKSNHDATKEKLDRLINVVKNKKDKSEVVSVDSNIQSNSVSKACNKLELKSLTSTSGQTVLTTFAKPVEKSLQKKTDLLDLPVEQIKKEPLEWEFCELQVLQEENQDLKERLDLCNNEKEEAKKDLERKKEMIVSLNAEIDILILKQKENKGRLEQIQKQLEEVFKNFDKENRHLQTVIDNAESKNQYLLAQKKDKDEEISGLQKEMIAILKDLNATKDKNNMLEKKILELQTEDDKLKVSVEKLKKELNDAHLELESNAKNRNNIVTKYEDLIKLQRDEIVRLKEESMNKTEFIEKQENRKIVKSIFTTIIQAKNVYSDPIETTLKDNYPKNNQEGMPKIKKGNIEVVELLGSDDESNVSKDSTVNSSKKTRKRKSDPKEQSHVTPRKLRKRKY